MIDEGKLRQRLSEVGLVVEALEIEPRLLDARPDVVVRADIDGRKISLVIKAKDRPHLSELRLAVEQLKQYEGPNRVPMVAAHFLGPNRRALLREMGMGYIDLVGNIYLRAPGIFIEREGKAKPEDYQQPRINPYSDKASIILRLLMDIPWHPWKIREIAEAGNITPGWASRVVDSMRERGLVEYSRQSGIRLLNWEDRLKEWADFYDWQRNRFYHYYCHAIDSQELLDKISKLDNENAKWALGFQAGANLIAPHSTFNQVHLLIEGRSFNVLRGKIERELKLDERKDGANLILVHPYYTVSALFRTQTIKKWRVVSDIQLYLDLNRYPLRGREQAEYLLEKIIRPKLNTMQKEKRADKRS